jgi:hypothetical protein
MTTPLTVQSYSCVCCSETFSDTDITAARVWAVYHNSGVWCGYFVHAKCARGRWDNICACSEGSVGGAMQVGGDEDSWMDHHYDDADEDEAEEEVPEPEPRAEFVVLSNICVVCEQVVDNDGGNVSHERSGPCGYLIHYDCLGPQVLGLPCTCGRRMNY